MIVALVADLLFGSKISATADHLRLPVRIVRRVADVAALADAHGPDASGVILDLSAAPIDALCEQIRAIRAARPHVPVVGFVPHVQADIARAARDAGATRVLARSKFTSELADLLQELTGGGPAPDVRDGAGAPGA